MKRIATLALLITLSSCIGFIAHGRSTRQIEQPYLTQERRSVKYPENNHSYTPTDVEQLWGAPDKKKTISPNTEAWVYNDNSELRWTGIILLAVLIPVPIMVPTGRDGTELYFERGRLESAVIKKYKYGYFFVCSPIPWFFQDRGEFQYPCLRPQ